MNGNFDPDGGAFAAALNWLQGTLFGTVATAIAAIAVASIGFLLLSGRIDVRRSVQVILGCFILFGASSIAAGIVHAVGRADKMADAPVATSAIPLAPSAAAVPAEARPYDPYAGAAVPPRR